MEYLKPHLSYEEQLSLLQKRGLGCHDPRQAQSLLRKVGYYRLSAYCYPLRQMLPPGQAPQTSVQFRLSAFREGHTFEEAAALYNFDKKLRLLMLDGIESFEVGVRVQIAHVLGKRDAFGHLHRDSLEQWRCDKESRQAGVTSHEEWLGRYSKQVGDAKSEDFVKHYTEKYDGSIPIWVATEIMDFGLLLRLFKLMHGWDRNSVSSAVGVKTGKVLDPWLLGLSHIRNTCAHHSRLWNRRLTYTLPEIPSNEVGSDLQHLGDLELPLRRKIYGYAAVLAYSLRQLDPNTQWPASFRTMITKKFPNIQGISPAQNMGFPEGWDSQPIWRHDS